jgi:hypothetical protein
MRLRPIKTRTLAVLLAATITLAATTDWWLTVVETHWQTVQSWWTDTRQISTSPSTPTSSPISQDADRADSHPALTPPSTTVSTPPADGTPIIGKMLAKALTVAPPSSPPPPPPPSPTAESRATHRPAYKIVGLTRGRHRAVILDLHGEQHAYRVLDQIPGWGTLVAIAGSRIQVLTDNQTLDTVSYRPTLELNAAPSDDPDHGQNENEFAQSVNAPPQPGPSPHQVTPTPSPAPSSAPPTSSAH